jgi:hypothetical protein
MTSIEIRNGKAVTTERANLRWYSIKRQLEGRTSLDKNGLVKFEASKHNLETWKNHFPDAEINDIDSEIKAFEEFAVAERPEFRFKREPLWWQKKATEKQRKIIDSKDMYNCFAFFFSPGSGKSKSLTDFAITLYCEGKIDALLILPPNYLVGEQWTNEDSGALVKDIHESIEFKSWLWDRTLTKTMKAEYEALLEFDGFQCIVANIDATKTERGFEYLSRFIKRHKGRVLIAVDEGHLISKPSSGRHKKCLELRRLCDWAAVLTGTPINKSLMSAWGIFRFLHDNILGYKYATAFRSAFCITKFNGFADQIIGHKNVDKFYELIEPYSQRVSQEEMGLTKMRDTFEFDMSKEQETHFKRFKAEWLTALENGEFASASIALTAALKLQQITCGFLVGEDGTVQYLDNARLRALDSWLETIDEDQKIMIWCRFLEDAKLLTNHFGGKAVDLSGNVDAKQRVKNKDRFLYEPSITRCIATPDAAGTGMDALQNVCNRAVFYSSSEHYINRTQAEDRTLRVGGGTTAFYTDLICRKSPDRKILRTLTENQALATYTLDDVRKMFED